MRLGLLVRKERWALSFRGKVVLLALAVVLALAVRSGAYPFLAVNSPVNADVLFVEGWISEVVADQVAAEFKRGHYRQLLVLRSVYGNETQVSYEAGAVSREYLSRLIVGYGVPAESLGTVYYPGVMRDRTYHAALAAREWFAKAGVPIKSFNVATEGPHARRSWLMFMKAFGNSADIGIVALQDPGYDPKHWWRTSEGVRELLGEAIAYLYARVFFFAVN